MRWQLAFRSHHRTIAVGNCDLRCGCCAVGRSECVLYVASEPQVRACNCPPPDARVSGPWVQYSTSKHCHGRCWLLLLGLLLLALTIPPSSEPPVADSARQLPRLSLQLDACLGLAEPGCVDLQGQPLPQANLSHHDSDLGPSLSAGYKTTRVPRRHAKARGHAEQSKCCSIQ